MIESNLLSSTQSGFKPNDYCVNQLISVTHTIFSAFITYPSLKIHDVFLELSKALDGIWHKGLLYKVKNSGLNGNPLNLLELFLHNRRHRVAKQLVF